MTPLPHDSLSLASLDEQVLHPGVKGLPIVSPLRQGAIGLQGWNVLRAETSFPVAILKHSALSHNLAWMKQFCAQYGALLAPHGKTTMSPQLFGAQLANGAWGITLANATQVQLAHRYGVRRVLMANQLVAPADIASMLGLLRDDPGFELFVLVDSIAGVARLAAAASAHRLDRPLPLLVELGMAGRRAGCRSDADALALAHAVARAPGLQLAGFEGYEGLQVTDDRAADIDAVDTFLARLVALTRQADADQLFMGRRDILISAGGSGYFDLVARGFHGMDDLSRPVLPIIRSGCYLTSDHGSYLRQIGELNAREAACCEHGHGAAGTHADGLQPALEVWSMVQSCPEPGLAILTMGKRDASYDIELPLPLLWHRPGTADMPTVPQSLPAGSTIFKMNDQHAYLRLPAGSDDLLAVGDLVGCGISHPCTTFDKWPLLLAVDDDYTVRYAVNTCF